jgi:hypothetical protein
VGWNFLLQTVLPINSLIVGGIPTVDHPWTLNTGGCSGTAISPRAVLTAAHCQVTGAWLQNKWVQASETFVHPLYKNVPNCAKNGFLNLHDLRVLYFNQPVFRDYMPITSNEVEPLGKKLLFVGARNQKISVAESKSLSSQEYPETQLKRMVKKATELGSPDAATDDYSDLRKNWSECYTGVLLAPLYSADGSGDTQVLPEPGDSGGSIIFDHSLVGVISGKIGYYSKQTGAPYSVTGINTFIGEALNQEFFRDLARHGVDIRWAHP